MGRRHDGGCIGGCMMHDALLCTVLNGEMGFYWPFIDASLSVKRKAEIPSDFRAFLKWCHAKE